MARVAILRFKFQVVGKIANNYTPSLDLNDGLCYDELYLEGVGF